MSKEWKGFVAVYDSRRLGGINQLCGKDVRDCFSGKIAGDYCLLRKGMEAVLCETDDEDSVDVDIYELSYAKYKSVLNECPKDGEWQLVHVMSKQNHQLMNVMCLVHPGRMEDWMRKGFHPVVGGDYLYDLENDCNFGDEPPEAISKPGQKQDIETILGHGLYGQDRAIRNLSRAMLMPNIIDRIGAENVFLLTGPAGSGQEILLRNLTELEESKGCSRPQKVFDLSGCSSQNSGFVINGMPFGYSDAGCGQVTDFIRRNPRGRVILRNVHLAHPNVQQKLVPILTEGMLEDVYGFYEGRDRKIRLAAPEVDFSQSQIILEMQLGTYLLENRDFMAKIGENDTALANSLWSALESEEVAERGIALDRQLFNALRQGAHLVPFVLLEFKDLVDIAETKLQEIEKNLEDRAKEKNRAPTGKIVIENRREIATALSLSQQNGTNVDGILQNAIELVSEALLQNRGQDKVTLRMSEKGCVALIEIVKELGKNPLRQMMRKNQALMWNLKCNNEQSEKVMELTDLHLEKLQHHKDFGNQFGICINIPDVRFDDIAGLQEIKDEFREIIQQMLNPKLFNELGCGTTPGVLLYGLPGTGKTTLAKAVAGECELPFIATTGTELLNPERAAKVFALARKYAPACVYIDEIDSLGDRQQGGNPASITQVLAEMDGFSGSKENPVLIIAATNNPRNLDDAFLRSGRLEIKIRVPRLDREGRRQFLEKFKTVIDEKQYDEERLLTTSNGLTGAEMTQVLREILRKINKLKLPKLGIEETVEQFQRVLLGERNASKNEESMERCAYHEAGHAVIAHILMPKVPVSEVSINGRGSNAGWTKLDSPSVSSLAEIKASLSMLLAGRAAAVHKFGPDAISQGDSGDLQKATQLALAAITENGMDEVIGHVHIDSMNKQCGDAIGALVLTRTRVWIDEAMQTAATTLAEQWETVELLVEKLLLHGELRGEMLEKCLNRDCQKVCAE